MTGILAVLVDGDNIGASHAGAIRATAASFAVPRMLRVYTDARKGTGWHEALDYRLIHAGAAKNAADVLLALDAMELAYTGRADCFVIASSDGDFSHLAQRLTEFGARVIGIGEAKAPERFRAACHQFTLLEPPKQVETPKPDLGLVVTAFDRKIRDIIKGKIKGKCADQTGILIQSLSVEMQKAHGLTISSQSAPSWRSYLAARPALYDLDPKGQTAKVRYRAKAFAAALAIVA